MYLQKINLKKKYALVTGAGKGLGRACSIALAEAGATVIALSRTPSDLNKLEKLGYQISLPKIKKNNQMDFLYWSTKEPLSINKYGIPEPSSHQIVYPSILLVPLVAFDNHLNRIGYGGGYYDRYIKKVKKNKKIILIGLAYSFQKVKKIPANKYDMKLDFIVTDKNFI